MVFLQYKFNDVIDPFDMQFDVHLFLQAATAIGRNKARVLI